jgi:hypothetical protein
MCFFIYILPECWKAAEKGHKDHEADAQHKKGDGCDGPHFAEFGYRQGSKNML